MAQISVWSCSETIQKQIRGGLWTGKIRGLLSWDDKRLGIGWRATHGYLVALHEVSNHQQAAKFAAQIESKSLKMAGFTLRGKESPNYSSVA